MKNDKLDLFPVFLTTYKRLGHLKQTIEALQANPLAEHTLLYVTSDGPMPGDELKIAEVRNYLDGLTGFREVRRIYRDENDRLKNWSIRREILEEHGAVIQLEEDCLVAPCFLEYMNGALRCYESDKSVFAVCGYVGDFVPQGQIAQSMRIPRFSAWGFGIWKNRDALVETGVSQEEYRRLRRDAAFLKTLKSETGLDYLANLWRVAFRGLLGYDLMSTLQVVKRGLHCVYPSVSIVQNIGHDGTGEHCKESSRFEIELATQLPEVCAIDRMPPKLLLRHAIFRSGGLKKYLHYRLRVMRGKYS